MKPWLDLKPRASLVRNAARAVALLDAGHGGAGLAPATVSWARKVAAGERLSITKVLEASAWLKRHGPNRASAAARRDPTSPAAVAWRAWFCDPSIPWSRRRDDPAAAWILDTARKIREAMEPAR